MISLTVLLLSAAVVSHAGQHPSDLFVGDWQGEGLVAQVIPRGSGNYQINFLPEFDVKCEPLAVIAGRATDGELRFEQDGWSGQAKGERMTGARPGIGQAEAFVLKKVVRLSPSVGAKPPKEAVILFDGSGFDEWEVQSGEDYPSGDRMGVVRGFHAGHAGRQGNAHWALADHEAGVPGLSLAL